MAGTGLAAVQSFFREKRRRTWFIVAAVAVFLVLLFIQSISISQYHIGFAEAYGILFHHLTDGAPSRAEDYHAWMKDVVVWDYNIPRGFGAIIIGATLAVGGAMMQSSLQNPIAEPYTTGISAGALLGATLFIVFGYSVIPTLAGDAALYADAMIFSLIPLAAILLVVGGKRNVSPTLMILIGISMMYIFFAICSFMRYNVEHEVAAEIYEWSLGTVGRIKWMQLPLLLGVLAALLLFALAIASKLNALSFGDRFAQSVGLNPKRLRVICLVIVSLVTAVVVSVAGTIGFVGLVCPQVSRLLVGADNREIVPVSAALGALMLLLADCISRTVTTAGLPVGAVTALIGSPIFIYMLVKNRRNAW